MPVSHNTERATNENPRGAGNSALRMQASVTALEANLTAAAIFGQLPAMGPIKYALAMAVWRLTHGLGQVSTAIGLTQLERSTGLHRETITMNMAGACQAAGIQVVSRETTSSRGGKVRQRTIYQFPVPAAIREQTEKIQRKAAARAERGVVGGTDYGWSAPPTTTCSYSSCSTDTPDLNSPVVGDSSSSAEENISPARATAPARPETPVNRTAATAAAPQATAPATETDLFTADDDEPPNPKPVPEKAEVAYQTPRDAVIAMCIERAGESPAVDVLDLIQDRILPLQGRTMADFHETVRKRLTQKPKELGAFLTWLARRPSASRGAAAPRPAPCTKCGNHGFIQHPAGPPDRAPDLQRRRAEWCACAKGRELRAARGDDYLVAWEKKYNDAVDGLAALPQRGGR